MISGHTDSVIRINNPVAGMTMIDNVLIVVESRSSSVSFYDRASLKLQSMVQFPAISDPYDLIGYKQILFVSERSDNKIHKLLLAEKIYCTWNFGCGIMASTLSITTQQPLHLFAACCEVPLTQFVVEINIYNRALIRRVSLQPNVMNIRHLISLPNGEFLISHGRRGDRWRCVCYVNNQGIVVKRYGGAWGSETGKLNEPIRLAVNKDGFIFVLDYSNNNVIMLNSNLEFVREVIPRTTLCKPYRMYSDDVTGRLYIGDGNGNNNRILCFDTQW